jgi:hypothetical protein
MGSVKAQRVMDELGILRLLATLAQAVDDGTRLVTTPASPTR